MSTQRLRSRITLAGCVVVAALVAWSSSASAALTHDFLSSFGASAGTQGIAVAEASGDVYVYDASAGTVSKFTAAGTPAEFSGLNADVIEGIAATGEGEIAVDNSAGPARGDIYVADGATVEIYGADGHSLGELTESAPKPWGRPCGVAVDSAGGVYVGLAGEPGAVNKYTPAANPVIDANYVASLWNLNNACNVAVDSTGNVYVDTYPEGPITKYGALQLSPIEAEPTGTVVAESGRALAVDNAPDPETASTDSLYVGGYSGVAQYEAGGALVDTFTGGEGAQAFANLHGLAVNGASGAVYVSDDEHARIEIFGPTVVVPDVTTGSATNVENTTATLHGSVNPDGLAVTGCSFEYGKQVQYVETVYQTVPCTPSPGSGTSPVAVSASISGLQANATYTFRLVASNANGTNTASPAQLVTLSPPLLEGESVSGLGYSTATLQAEINPVGFETSYHFEYGPTVAYGADIPIPDATLAASQEVQSVSARSTNLQPDTQYHYRIVATSARGTTAGPDQVFTTFAAAQSGQADACPNTALREGGLSENLPDCRAYELVSPVDKNDADIIGQYATNLSSLSGNAIVFAAHNGFGDTRGSGAAGGNMYVAYRGASEWKTRAILPTPATNVIQILAGSTVDNLFSAELDRSVVEAYALPAASGGVPEGMNLYLQDNLSGRLETITEPQGSEAITNPLAIFGAVRGGSSDLGVVGFESAANFLPQTTGSNRKLYAMNHGKLELAGVLPGGVIPAGGSTAPRSGEQIRKYRDTVSADGSRMFFLSPADESSPPQIYMREDAGRTVWVSQSEASTPDPEPQNIKFQGATPDGAKALFSTTDRLLDSDPGGPGYALYLFTNGPSPETEPNLRFIGRFTTVGNGTEPVMLGMSTDAKRIYFTTGEENQTESQAFPVYLWDEGVIHEVTDRYVPSFGEGQGMQRVSSDGERFAFFSRGQGLLTGPHAGPQRTELYLYDAPTQTLRCVSCPAGGAAAMSDVDTGPAATNFGVGLDYGFQHNYMSSDGSRLFFSTPEPLVPRDTNGLSDVYEYDVASGKDALLSSGTGDHGAWFADASPSGDDLFFVSQQSYSRLDKDDLVDLYDARVNGGLPEPVAPSVPCQGDACQGTPSAAPTFNTASGFEGLGNVSRQQVTQPKAKPKAKKQAKKKKIKPKKHAAKKRQKKRRAGKKNKHSGKQASHRSGR